MGDILIITASAGSGKTHRLAEELKTALESEASAEESARPEAVLATTFTNRAAASLRERVRRHLIAAGNFNGAQRLTAARIGTVNAVCGQLVEQFALDLGLSPTLRVLDEDLALQTLDRAISSVLDNTRERQLAALKSRMEQLEWPLFVRSVVQNARSNGIAPEALDDCASRSWKSMRDLFGEADADGSALEQDLCDALETFVVDASALPNLGKGSQKCVDDARKAHRRLKDGKALSWRQWASLVTMKLGKRDGCAALGGPLIAAAGQHDVHPTLHGDLEAAIGAVFALARKAMETYQAQKRSWGVIDFVDQEVFALELLSKPDVRERLQGELDLVLVDEFQDTSPLQLAIFLELAKLAKRSIWVGDQKQAIFGFRGTDPALMDTTLEELMGGSDPDFVDRAVEAVIQQRDTDRLPHSWRSRPELVELTSEVFVQAFLPHGLDEDRVKLTSAPELGDEPSGLGAIVEYWPLELENKARTSDAPKTLASGIRALLDRSEGSHQVRVRAGDTVRPVRPGDIAVLCRTNHEAHGVASALEGLGIRASVPRTGLFNTTEGRVALASISLWADPYDGVAALTLSRIVSHPDDPVGLLSALWSEDVPGSAFADPFVAVLRDAREAHGSLGVMAGIDAAFEAANLRTLCARWGRTQERLANLDQVRALAQRFVLEQRERGLETTMTGLLSHLTELEDESFDPARGTTRARGDHRAIASDDDSVTVMTWHRSKGLEWPVTIVGSLERDFRVNPLKVRALSAATDGRPAFDLDDPLAGRWIRFWPTPYAGVQKGTPFKERLEKHSEYRRVTEEHLKEQLRLLYVAWTRARDVLVLAAIDGKFLKGALQLLKDESGNLLIQEPLTEEPVRWAGKQVAVPRVAAAIRQPMLAEPQPGETYRLGERRMMAPAWRSPSAVEADGTVSEVETLGEPLALGGDPDMQAVGEVLHGFLAADGDDLEVSERIALAQGLLERWSLGASLNTSDCVDVSNALRGFVEERWPGATLHREFPVTFQTDEGTVVRGTADLVVETAESFVVIDHKALHGPRDRALDRAAGYAGQLRSYAEAVARAKGKPAAATMIHLPLLGLVATVNETVE